MQKEDTRKVRPAFAPRLPTFHPMTLVVIPIRFVWRASR